MSGEASPSQTTSQIEAGQVWQHHTTGKRYRVRRVTACFAFLNDEDGYDIGRVRLANLRRTARHIGTEGVHAA
jgi:hypothetical protein